MKPLLLIAAALVLAGCAAPEPITVVQEVKVPVVMPCVPVDSVPPVRERATDGLSRDDDLLVKVRAVTADLKVLEADDRVLRALISGCVEAGD